MLLKILLFVGATAVTIIAERLNLSTRQLVAVAVVSYAVAGAVVFRVRLRAAWRALKNPYGEVDATPAGSQRLRDTHRILLEAAAYVRAMPQDHRSARMAAEMAFMIWDTVPVFLDRAFLVPPTGDYKTFLVAERPKHGDNPDMRRAASDFLVRLAKQIKEENLDDGFLMPSSWKQFCDSDPEKNWPANAR